MFSKTTTVDLTEYEHDLLFQIRKELRSVLKGIFQVPGADDAWHTRLALRQRLLPAGWSETPGLPSVNSAGGDDLSRTCVRAVGTVIRHRRLSKWYASTKAS